MPEEVVKSEDQWRQELTPLQYQIMREQGTEPPFTGKFVHHKADGAYTCAACGAELFGSDTKFDSGTGWPSFYDVRNSDAVILRPDHSHGMNRTEVVCANCGSHLGHLFEDGPNPTGLRYCINSCALDFDGEEA